MKRIVLTAKQENLLDEWQELTKGIPARYVALAMGKVVRGVNFVGCNKRDMGNTFANVPPYDRSMTDAKRSELRIHIVTARVALAEQAHKRANQWQPTSGEQAWSKIHERNVDVVLVNGRRRNAQVCFPRISTGKLYTDRSHRLADLRPPKDAHELKAWAALPVMGECEECAGTGQTPKECVSCNATLTKADVAANPESDACIQCCRLDERDERSTGAR